MAKKPPSLADRRERLPEVGGVLHLEHFNCEVLDHDIVTTFFMAGLGLTRDPYRRTDHRNMGVNIGLQQFHLPRRGMETPPYHGEIGLVVPEFKAMKARLDRLKRDGKFKGTRYAWKMEGRTPVVTAPWGLKLRLQKAGTVPFLRPLGMNYVDVPVEPGLAAPIGGFFSRLMEAPVAMRSIRGERSAVVTMGPFQYARFRERKLKDYDLYRFHMAYYVSRYNRIRDAVAEQGCMDGKGLGQVFFFSEIFDPENGDTLLEMTQEARSVYHPDFMRPLVNRWPIVGEPFSDQAAAQAALADVGAVAPGAKA